LTDVDVHHINVFPSLRDSSNCVALKNTCWYGRSAAPSSRVQLLALTYTRHQLLKTSRKCFRSVASGQRGGNYLGCLAAQSTLLTPPAPLSGYDSTGLGLLQIIASFSSATFLAMWSRYAMVDLSKRLGLLAHFAPASNRFDHRWIRNGPVLSGRKSGGWYPMQSPVECLLSRFACAFLCLQATFIYMLR
jgi:hypothetical protein